MPILPQPAAAILDTMAHGTGTEMGDARVARLTETDWRAFAGVRLRALTDSLGTDDPQFQRESTFKFAQPV